MMILNNMECPDDRIKKIGYIVICGVIMEVLHQGRKVALSGELKSLKKLVNSDNINIIDDGALLRILDEPQVKIASVAADYGFFEVLQPYSLVNLIDDPMVLEDKWATDMGWKLFWRYMFYRTHPRVRDRYVNFTRVLLTAQRALFELLKLMVTHETRAFGKRYRSNYSPGRLKALMTGKDDKSLLLIAGFIRELNKCEMESRELLLK
jgi:hypothetical protein